MRPNSYPGGLTDGHGQQIERLIPSAKPVGRPAKYSRREIENAILY